MASAREVISMWIWLVAVLILGYILIMSSQESIEAREIELEIDARANCVCEFRA